MSDDYAHHWGIGTDTEGKEGFAEAVGGLLAAFPSLHFTADQIWVADDTVIVRWIDIGVQELEFNGIPPSQETVTWTGISIFRIECGKAVEGWAEADHFGRIQQQGVIPAPEATPSA
jgi:predicted ester cyclase